MWSPNPFPNLTNFLHEYDEYKSKENLVGLLQAGHAMSSGIEKNLPGNASKYLGQDVTHMWLATAFGYPVTNLLVNTPPILTISGWNNLLKNIEALVQELINLIPKNNPQDWQDWREKAISTNGFLRQVFTTTLAETRLPNNDVTLWDQSYVAASLFKSAVAGAVLELKENNFQWQDQRNKDWKLKQETKWRLLTVGFGSDYYASRAVRIGDWSGTWLDIQDFFEEVRKLIEVDLALGNLLYKDTQLCVFSFPAEQNPSSVFVNNLKPCLEKKIATIAKSKNLETPPYCNILDLSSRSLIKIIKEIKGARDKLVIPIHQNWEICEKLETTGYVCPVCQVRLNGNNSKDKPCRICRDRRHRRLKPWLTGQLGTDTIWIPELADDNDRVALLTFNFNLEPWLNGTKVDSLRAQAIREWVIDQKSKNQNNPIDENKSFESLLNYIKGKLSQFDKTDIVLKNLHDGYQHEKTWENFFEKIVEDRSDSPKWDQLNDDERARWLTHQLLRKHPSPGRVYRFWRTTETFFDELLQRFRETTAIHENRWRVKRLIIKDASSSSKPDSNTYYESRVDDKSINLLYRKNTGDFITIFNLARILKDNNDPSVKLKELTLKDDEGKELKIKVSSINDRNSGSLGIYHPVIPIERSPERFRILVPLSAATACVNQAIEKWQTEFARVWDRMPLQVGIVAFPQKSPIQGIIEAARNMEDALAEKTETWRVETKKTCGDCVALSLEREQDKKLELQTVPVRLPDGRADVFYPYCTVEDSEVRFSLDFKHPKGTVYRHVEELRIGEGITVSPARFAMTFMDSSAERFEPIKTHYLADWSKMQAIWQLLTEVAPSQTALQGVWQSLAEQRQKWQNLDGTWTKNEEKQIWLNFARSLLAEQLGVKGQILATLVEAVDWYTTSRSINTLPFVCTRSLLMGCNYP
ncbi:MAG: CRISPR-associated protein Csx11 [Pseudomonadota bacterium]|nr:CRISPR-associated protein Csx11 [Pseudomonadota bacterium]